jgi:hypothetical protein
MEFTTIANAQKETGLSYLGNINSSAKTVKSKKISHQYTYAVYLAPAKQSGYNLCSHSTPECRLGCLVTSGRAGMEVVAGKTKIQNCRVKKSRLFVENKDYYMQWMIAEIKKYKTKAEKDGFYFSVRLNATSDIDWGKTYYKGFTIFEIFPDVAFYDYTKNADKFVNMPSNYHLTFSYTGYNWDKCKELLNKGFNIAVVFNVKNETELPETWRGYDVINGDLTDYRIADGKGIIVGLKWKTIGNKDANEKIKNSVFVVQPNEFAPTTDVSNVGVNVGQR